MARQITVKKRLLQVNKKDCTGVDLWEDTCFEDDTNISGCGDYIGDEWLEDTTLGSTCDSNMTRHFRERRYLRYAHGCLVATNDIREGVEQYSAACGFNGLYLIYRPVEYTSSSRSIVYINGSSYAPEYRSDEGLYYQKIDISKWTSASLMLYYFSGYVYVDEVLYVPPTTNVTNMSNMFTDQSKCRRINTSTFNTSKVTDMSYMFFGCNSLTDLSVSNFDVSSVENMSRMFTNCEKITNLDIERWSVSKVTDMALMFQGCKSLQNIDFFKNWNCANLTCAESLFAGCSSVRNINLPNISLPKLETFNWGFHNCENLETADISGWKTPKLITASLLFANCEKLKTVNMAGITINGKSGSYEGCGSYSLNVGSGASNMFMNCPSLETVDLSGLAMRSYNGIFGVSAVMGQKPSYYDDPYPNLRTIILKGCNSTTVGYIKRNLEELKLTDQVTIVT